jgi:predicted nucleic acid-binding protein
MGTRAEDRASTKARGVSPGVTFDTGAFIAVERRKERARKIYERLRERDVLITAPLPVIGEWWRGRTDWRERILRSVRIEPLTLGRVQLAGEALAAVSSRGGSAAPSIVDAIVVASAASRGDLVYTSDVADLERLCTFFPGVRVLAI